MNPSHFLLLCGGFVLSHLLLRAVAKTRRAKVQVIRDYNRDRDRDLEVKSRA